MKKSIRNRILARSAELFAAEGFSVSIDRLIAHSDAARMTVYKYFLSKEALLLAVLERCQDQLLRRLQAVEEDPSTSPSQQLAAAFAELGRAMHEPETRAGLLSQALLEFPDPRHPVHALACHSKRQLLSMLEDFVRRARLSPDPAARAAELLVAAEGAFVADAVLGPAASWRAACGLLESSRSPAATAATGTGRSLPAEDTEERALPLPAGVGSRVNSSSNNHRNLPSNH